MKSSSPLTKSGPKRRRRSRRELPFGQRSLWGSTTNNFKREREAVRAPSLREQLAEVGA
jgi:hypothetical protein